MTDQEDFEKYWAKVSMQYLGGASFQEFAKSGFGACAKIKNEKIKELERKLLIFSDDLDKAGNELFIQEGQIKEMKELLNEIINDDSSRYNRPSYYYKCVELVNGLKKSGSK